MYNSIIKRLASYKHNIISKVLLLLILLISIYFITLLYFNFKTDEDVSMGLIQHSYYNIINIDSLDVHPPLYYLLLKLFIDLTTFWTKSIFVETVFARLFSTILLILFLIFMIKLVKRLNIRINYKWQIVLFLIAPGVVNESTKIRMYSLGASLIAAELYELVKFYQDKDNKSIVLATIFASLASYTFYPLAISAGLFLLLYFILQLFDHKKEFIKILISGILLLVLYMPWIPILLDQMEFHSSTDNILAFNYFNSAVTAITQLNAPSPRSPLLKYISIISLIVIVLFVYVIKYSIKNFNKEFNMVFSISIINFILTLILSLIFSRRQFRTTITYPIFAIFMFFIILIIIKKYQLFNLFGLFKNNKLFLFLSFMTLFIFVGYMGLATIFNVKSYDIPSIRLVKNMKKWHLSNDKNVDLSKTTSIRKEPLVSTAEANQDSIYLKSINKKAIIPNNKMSIIDSAQGTFNNRNSTELLKNVFNNLYFKSVK